MEAAGPLRVLYEGHDLIIIDKVRLSVAPSIQWVRSVGLID